MDSQDQRSAVEAIVCALRKSTRIIRGFPFAYLFLFSIYMLIFPFMPEWISGIIDVSLVGNPLFVLLLLSMSRVLKLCAWHKTACIIPASTRIEGYIDSYIFTFTQNDLIVIHVCIGIIAIVFLAFAFKKFFINGRKKISHGNP